MFWVVRIKVVIKKLEVDKIFNNFSCTFGIFIIARQKSTDHVKDLAENEIKLCNCI